MQGGSNSIYFINPDGSILRKINFPVIISPYLNIGFDGTLYFTAEEGVAMQLLNYQAHRNLKIQTRFH